MLEEILGLEGSLLHQPLVRRASSGLPECPNEMSGRHATSPPVVRRRSGGCEFGRTIFPWRALSHLARRGSLASSCRLAKVLNLLNPGVASHQVKSSKNG